MNDDDLCSGLKCDWLKQTHNESEKKLKKEERRRKKKGSPTD
jgi:hypothetical protein